MPVFAQNKPFVLGMQEWPDEGTAHNTTYQKLLKESNCTVVVGTDYGAISVVSAISYHTKSCIMRGARQLLCMPWQIFE